MLIAQAVAGFSIVHWAILVIIIGAIAGIVFVALRQFGVQIPPFMVTVFWIVVAAVFCIGAVKLIASL